MGRQVDRSMYQQTNGGAPLTAPTCETPPYVLLGAPTTSEITINIFSDLDSVVKVFYAGPMDQHNLETQPMQVQASQAPARATLTNLSPGTTYHYVVAYQNGMGGKYCTQALTSEVRVFTTAKSTADTFRFGVVADIHLNQEGGFMESVVQQTFALMQQEVTNPGGMDFVVDLGDTFMNTKVPYPTKIEPYQRIFRLYSQVCNQAPLFLVNGNHDGEVGWDIQIPNKKHPENPPVEYVLNRKAYFSNPLPNAFYSGNTVVEFEETGYQGNYFAFDWGNALIIGLDPFWYTRTISRITDKHGVNLAEDPWSWTLGEDQYNWLYDTLANTKAKFKFIMMHHVTGGVFGTPKEGGGGGGAKFSRYFEWGGYDRDGQHLFEQKRPTFSHGPIHDFLVKFGVQVVFKGHDHLNNKGDLDGVLYHTLPKPSLDTFGKPPTTAEEQGYPYEDSVLESGYMMVTVSPTVATVTYTSFKGEQMDEYSVYPTA